jgi:general stress protein YciG
MSPKNRAAVALGRKGGHARAANMTPEQRSEAARKAVEARWSRIETNLSALEAKQRERAKKNKKAT